MVTHEGNQEGAGAFFRELRDIGISAVIVSDPALIEICATEAPGLPIHLSTQASATNYETLEFWKNEGLERVVLAREVSMEEVARFVKIRTLKLKPLFMEQCVFLIQVVVLYPTICRCGMPIVAVALNLVVGNMSYLICLLGQNVGAKPAKGS